MSQEQEKMQKWNDTYSKMELNPLTKKFDELNDSINSTKYQLTVSERDSIQSLINSKDIYRLDFKHAKGLVELRKTLSDNASSISTNDLRLLQSLLVSCTFSSGIGAEIIADSITALTPHNMSIHEKETELRVVATFLTRKEQEAETGLKYSEEDTKNLIGAEKTSDKAEEKTEAKAEEKTEAKAEEKTEAKASDKAADKASKKA